MRAPRAERVATAGTLAAPLALLFPWAAVRDHLGIALVGPDYFLKWLTKYPTLGPVNRDVGLGILCLAGAAAVPPALAAYGLTRSPGRGRAFLLGLGVMFYLPVLVRLDLTLLAVGLTQDPEAVGGPLLRAVGLGSSAWLTWRTLWQSPSRAVAGESTTT